MIPLMKTDHFPPVSEKYRPAWKSHARAFTLVEVVIAIGIVTFAVLPIIALLPIGLQAMHDAMGSTVRTQIADSLLAEVELLPFDVLSTYTNGVTKYFDPDGKPMSAPLSARYKAEIFVSDPVYPGAPSSAADSLLNLQIRISDARTGGASRIESIQNVLAARSDVRN